MRMWGKRSDEDNELLEEEDKRKWGGKSRMWANGLMRKRIG